jgi:hypothetical protein
MDSMNTVYRNSEKGIYIQGKMGSTACNEIYTLVDMLAKIISFQKAQLWEHTGMPFKSHKGLRMYVSKH